LADQGAIGQLAPSFYTKKYPGWIGPGWSTQTYLDVNCAGTISGVVKENDVAKEGVWVYLFWRGDEGTFNYTSLIDRVKSAADGSFSFTGLDTTSDAYFVVALDPAGGTQYNIARADKVMPV
jgi:hypothetical protein